MNQSVQTTQPRFSGSVVAFEGDVARPLVELQTPEAANVWQVQASQALRAGAMNQLEHIRHKADARALVLGFLGLGAVGVLLYLAWTIAFAVAGLVIAGVGALGLTWLYFKGDSLIKDWRVERELAEIKREANRQVAILAVQQETLARLKKQAAADPVSTRQLDAERMRTTIKRAQTLAGNVKAQADRLAAQLVEFRKRHPGRPTGEYDNQVTFHQEWHGRIILSTNKAAEDLDAFCAETTLLEMSLQLAAGGRELAEFMGASDAQADREKVLRDFASSQAKTDINASIALLETAMSRDNITGRF